MLFPLTFAHSVLPWFTSWYPPAAATSFQSSVAAPEQVVCTMAAPDAVLPPAVARHCPFFCSTTRKAPLCGCNVHCSLLAKLQCHWTAAVPGVFDAPVMSRHLPLLPATMTE